MRVTVLNGPNLNLLGTREPEIYGRTTLLEIESMIRDAAAPLGITVRWLQTNHEGTLVDEIQRLPQAADGLILNAGAYSHSSLAIRDALLAVRIPFVEVHVTDPTTRDEARRRLVFADLALEVIKGKGAEGYRLALHALHRHLRDH
jgi:3-dehydroquinate dehydratase-2